MWRCARAGLAVAAAVAAGGLACEDAIKPSLPKRDNMPPETFLQVAGDSLQRQLYTFPLHWLGTDPDGEVVAYRYRWRCPAGVDSCLVDSAWVETTAVSAQFVLPVPDSTATYLFEVAAVDDDGSADPTPAAQTFDLFNHAPVAGFVAGTLPQKTLPAITFYLTAVDPDTTVEADDGDSRVGLDHYRVWLDGSEARVKQVPIDADAVTLRLEDFEGRFGMRTVFVQAVDTGNAVSAAVSHTWEVDSAPIDGILLVDDCRMGGFLAQRSDESFRNVLDGAAPNRYRVMDIEALPRLSRDDLEATLLLFDRVIWYTDADTTSSGALELAREGLRELLEVRHGSLLLSSGLVFGTRSAFGELEPEFRRLFGIDTVYVAPDGGTNFSLSRQDTIQAAVHPGLTSFRMLSLGLRPIMDCFGIVPDSTARSLYFYPPGKLERGGVTNPVQYDIGVYHETGGGARTICVSFPIGLPINANMGENETEILELLRLAGIVDP